MRKPFIAGNWKMYKTPAQAKEFAEEFKKLYTSSDVKVCVAAPFTALAVLKEAFEGTDIKLGAQNMHFEAEGAFTGEISAEMLKEIGVDYVIIGHSERRQYFAETDETVNLKAKKAFKAGLLPIICCGETLEQREANIHMDFVAGQVEKALEGLSEEELKATTIAYEPIWAIGTGKTASPEQAQEMCGYIREVVCKLYGEDISEEMTIQYGGSVKPANATELMNMDDIDGALVGGASLVPQNFIDIIHF